MSAIVTTQEKTRNLFYSVFGWMTIALSITGGWAYVIASRPHWIGALITKPYLGLTVLITQLVVVIVFSTLLPRLSYTSALMLFLAYAALSGTTLSIIFIRYSLPSIIQTLFITGGMFASVGLYGYVTKSDLSQLRSILLMALWGMILALLVNIFVRSSALSTLISIVGVVLFSALTAYDIQKIKRLSEKEHFDQEGYAKIGLYGALILYLDFINLFLSLLNLGGRRRN